jgi:uncharacterized SAM-binding protein YcdF (DUF218 family)
MFCSGALRIFNSASHHQRSKTPGKYDQGPIEKYIILENFRRELINRGVKNDFIWCEKKYFSWQMI